VNDLNALFQQIEKLSPESRAQLAGFVQFLQWQDTQKQADSSQHWSFSFIEAFKDAAVYATNKPDGMDVKMAAAVVGSESRPALWAHPPLSGQTVIEFHVPAPKQVRAFKLRLAVGVRDGAQVTEDNLVAFGVKVNGLRVWSNQTNDQSWQVVEIPLKIAAGDIAQIQFTTEALGSHQWTWAVWGNPELVGTIAG
jgi:hypothetical protein